MELHLMRELMKANVRKFNKQFKDANFVTNVEIEFFARFIIKCRNYKLNV